MEQITAQPNHNKKTMGQTKMAITVFEMKMSGSERSKFALSPEFKHKTFKQLIFKLSVEFFPYRTLYQYASQI